MTMTVNGFGKKLATIHEIGTPKKVEIKTTMRFLL